MGLIRTQKVWEVEKMGTYTYHVETVQSWLALSRLHILIHLVAVLSLCYYRIRHLLLEAPTAAWVLMTVAELILSVMWFFNQAFRWRPVSRRVMTEKLPREENLPGLDIYVCTLDPEKEPTVEVMDTIISATAMDYPSDKLAVYLSDDGGCAVTLYAMREAAEFAKEWVPFCKKYGVKSRCPKVFFSPSGEDEHLLRDDGFSAQRDLIKAKYEKMQKNIEKFGSDPKNCRIVSDRPPRIEVCVSLTHRPTSSSMDRFVVQ